MYRIEDIQPISCEIDKCFWSLQFVNTSFKDQSQGFAIGQLECGVIRPCQAENAMANMEPAVYSPVKQPCRSTRSLHALGSD
jgi:hypothetical protein